MAMTDTKKVELARAVQRYLDSIVAKEKAEDAYYDACEKLKGKVGEGDRAVIEKGGKWYVVSRTDNDFCIIPAERI